MPETPAAQPDRRRRAAGAHSPATHFFAGPDEVELAEVDLLDESTPPASLWKDAWIKLRRRPLFLVSAGLIVLILAVALFPGLFSKADMNTCYLADSLKGPAPGHPFGFDLQGCDIYARVIHGARPSVLVGVLAMLSVLVLGGAIGAIAGYYGKWADAILSRVGDIFFAIPTVLAAIVFLQSMRDRAGVMGVVVVLAAFGWPQMARITRSAVLAVRGADFVTAARALGVSRTKILLRHVMPNAASPMIVTATVSLGTYIVAEATLSFLGLGLPITMRSWGWQIGAAKDVLRHSPEVLLWPAGALAITVLAFIMLGDAVKDALDPKARR
ncbi:MAG: ABC transporter permease [Bifidobacteriaceae bacterium]|nr:ABC transporter permease [Bifidobacteriaceae bacterium]